MNVLVLEYAGLLEHSEQASKATPARAVAKLRPPVNRLRQKDLGCIAMATATSAWRRSPWARPERAGRIQAVVEAEAYPQAGVVDRLAAAARMASTWRTAGRGGGRRSDTTSLAALPLQPASMPTKGEFPVLNLDSKGPKDWVRGYVSTRTAPACRSTRTEHAELLLKLARMTWKGPIRTTRKMAADHNPSYSPHGIATAPRPSAPITDGSRFPWSSDARPNDCDIHFEKDVRYDLTYSALWA